MQPLAVSVAVGLISAPAMITGLHTRGLDKINLIQDKTGNLVLRKQVRTGSDAWQCIRMV